MQNILRTFVAFLLCLSLLPLPCFGAGMFIGTGTPAVDTIAYDNAASDAPGNGAQTDTLSFTVGSSADRILCAHVGIVDTGGPTTVSTITYNGSSLTKIRRDVQVAASNASEIWCILAPASGTHNLVTTLTAAPAQLMIVGVVSLSGVHQSLTVDSQNTAQAGSGQPGGSTTTVAINAWVLDGVIDNNPDTVTATSPQTARWNTVASSSRTGFGSTQGPVVTPASKTMAWTGLSGSWTQSIISLAPGP